MLTIKQISANIKSMNKAEGGYNAKMQETLVSIALHGAQNGDVRKANDLIASIQSDVTARAVVAWLMKFAPVMRYEHLTEKTADEVVKACRISAMLETPNHVIKLDTKRRDAWVKGKGNSEADLMAAKWWLHKEKASKEEDTQDADALAALYIQQTVFSHLKKIGRPDLAQFIVDAVAKYEKKALRETAAA